MERGQKTYLAAVGGIALILTIAAGIGKDWAVFGVALAGTALAAFFLARRVRRMQA